MNYNTVIRRRLAILAATLALLLAGATHVPAQGGRRSSLPGERLRPTVDLSQAIQWSTVPDVQAYYLYVGTSVGAKTW
jgi:hypothetical protein